METLTEHWKPFAIGAILLVTTGCPSQGVRRNAPVIGGGLGAILGNAVCQSGSGATRALCAGVGGVAGAVAGDALKDDCTTDRRITIDHNTGKKTHDKETITCEGSGNLPEQRIPNPTGPAIWKLQ